MWGTTKKRRYNRSRYRRIPLQFDNRKVAVQFGITLHLIRLKLECFSIFKIFCARTNKCGTYNSIWCLYNLLHLHNAPRRHITLFRKPNLRVQ